MKMPVWIDVCDINDIDREDVMRFDVGAQTFAIYRATDDSFHATDGMCTHEGVHLADGLVMDDIIECPKHNGRFNFRTGQAIRTPVCINLRCHAVQIVDGRVQLALG
jgi:3-phenylpropionate/trans-cinnamate dioxygenase ferredoxin component